MSFGVTIEGFVRKRLSDIKEEIEQTLRAQLGDSINLIAPSIFSQLVGIISEREAEIWELAEDTYNSAYPSTAEGVALDNAVAVSGLTRLPATFSKAIAYLFGTPGTTVPAGTIVSVLGNPDARFATNADALLGAGVDEIQKVGFASVPSSGSFRLSYEGVETALIAFNASAANVRDSIRSIDGLQDTLVSGDFTAGFNVTFTGIDAGKRPQPMLTVQDNTLLNGILVVITVTETTPGISQATVALTAEDAGAIQAPVGTLSVIETPVSGLNTVYNSLAADVGRDTETDLELRLRQQESDQVGGAATIEAIRSRLRNVPGVTSVTVVENDRDVVDSEDRPPHSFEAIVEGGEDQDVADEIFAAKAAGIRSYGNTSVVVIDSMGFSHDVEFSRPIAVPIYMELTVTTNSQFPTDGAAQIKAKLVDRGRASFGSGDDVIVIPTLIGVLDEVPGITDVDLFVGTAPNPVTSNNIVITTGEIATFDTSRILVNGA